MPFARPVLSVLLSLGVVAGLLLGLAVLVGALADAGDTGPPQGQCRDYLAQDQINSQPRDAAFDSTSAQQWQQRWDQFSAQLRAGQPASVTFSEKEVTSRAAEYLKEKNAPLDDLTVCFHNGEAEARAKAKLPALGDLPLLGGAFDTRVRVRDTIDMSGEHPRIRISSIDGGNLPDFATNRIKSEVENAVNDRLTNLGLAQKLTVTFSEGQAQVSGQP